MVPNHCRIPGVQRVSQRVVVQGDDDCDARGERPHKAQDATKLDDTFMEHSRTLSHACTLEGAARANQFFPYAPLCWKSVQLFCPKPSEEKALFFFFFFNSRHTETSFGEYYFGLGKWLDANLGKKAVPPRAQGQLTPAFKEQETWDKGVGVRMSSLAPRRKRKRT